MPMGDLELLILPIIILLFFRAKRVPELAKSVGMGTREQLKKAVLRRTLPRARRRRPWEAPTVARRPPRAPTETNRERPPMPPRQSEMGRTRNVRLGTTSAPRG
jgi:Sec-independent protein translocase protein TatA